jgi:ribosomal protein L14
MLLKESWLSITDNTNICWVKVFHLYKGFHRKVTKPGLITKSSARVVEPPRLEYKGFKYKYNIKGDIIRSWLVRSKYPLKYNDQSIINFNSNSGVIITKKQNLKSKFLNGPLPLPVKIRKLHSLFTKSL